MGTPTMCINFSCISKKVQTRRNFLSAAFMAVVLKTHSAKATYGDSANVFGKITNKSGFVAFAGDGFSLLLPSKWNPSKEKDFPSVALRTKIILMLLITLLSSRKKLTKAELMTLEHLNNFSILFRFCLVNNPTPEKQYQRVDSLQIEYLLRQF